MNQFNFYNRFQSNCLFVARKQKEKQTPFCNVLVDSYAQLNIKRFVVSHLKGECNENRFSACAAVELYDERGEECVCQSTPVKPPHIRHSVPLHSLHSVPFYSNTT
jgi:hypothetical protein